MAAALLAPSVMSDTIYEDHSIVIRCCFDEMTRLPSINLLKRISLSLVFVDAQLYGSFMDMAVILILLRRIVVSLRE